MSLPLGPLVSALRRRAFCILGRTRGPYCRGELSASCRSFFFFFNDTATTEIYTLSLHDALPIWFEICPWSVSLTSVPSPAGVSDHVHEPCSGILGSAMRVTIRLGGASSTTSLVREIGRAHV